MTERELLVLRRLAAHSSEFVRPMDIGGRDGSYHSAVLARLCKKGFAAREPRGTLTNYLRGFGKGSKRASSWLYRITPLGFETLESYGPSN